MTLLDIDRLTLDPPDGTRPLDGISLSVAAGETVGPWASRAPASRSPPVRCSVCSRIAP